MPAICGTAIKELVHNTVSDVIIDGVNGDFSCLPTARSELFSVPSNISLCSSRFIQGVLLGAGCDASFIGYCARLPIFVTSVRPINTIVPAADGSCGVGATIGASLGVNAGDLSQILLIFQLLVHQTQVSLSVNERVQWCQFAYRLPAGGGVDAEISTCSTSAITPDPSTGCPTACGGYAVLNNGTPDQDNCFDFRQPFALQTDQRISATVDFDTIQASNGDCINVLDILANTSSVDCFTCTPACNFTASTGLIVKADFAIDGILCKQVC